MITTSSFLAMVAAPIVAGGVIAALKNAIFREERNLRFPEDAVPVRASAHLRICN